MCQQLQNSTVTPILRVNSPVRTCIWHLIQRMYWFIFASASFLALQMGLDSDDVEVFVRPGHAESGCLMRYARRVLCCQSGRRPTLRRRKQFHHEELTLRRAVGRGLSQTCLTACPHHLLRHPGDNCVRTVPGRSSVASRVRIVTAYLWACQMLILKGHLPI